MKKSFIVTAVLLLLYAQQSTALMDIPGRTNHWVNDYAGVIDINTKTFLEKTISSVRQKTPDNIEIIVATFPDTGGWEINKFAQQYFNNWGSTKTGRDNGVVILIVVNDGQIQIGVGKNLAKILPDSVIDGIVAEDMIPYLRKGDYSTGVKKASLRIISILEGADIPHSSAVYVWRALLLALILLAVFLTAKPLTARLRRHRGS